MARSSKRVSKKKKVEPVEEIEEEEEDIDEDLFDEDDDDLEEEEEEYDEEDLEEDDDDLEDDEEEEEEEEDDEEEEEDLEDDEDEIDGLSRSSEEEGIGKRIITIGIVALMLISAIGVGIVLIMQAEDVREKPDDEKKSDPYDGLGNDIKSVNPTKAQISEIDPFNEWFEVFIMGDETGTTEGWKFTSFDEPLIGLATVTGLSMFSFIVFHTGNGTDDLDCSDGSAVVHLGLGDDILNDTGDEIALFDSNTNLIDFVGYGDGNGDTPRDGWFKSYYPQAPSEGYTLSIIGTDQDELSDWKETLPSRDDFPLQEIDLSEDGFNETIQIRTGRKRDQVIDTNGTWNRQLVIKARGVIKRGGPLEKKDLEDTLEYASHTYKTLRRMGFDVPEVTGHKNNGKPFLRIVVTKNGDYEGYYDADNKTVHVDLGSNKFANKQTVEHEVFHAFQMKQRADGSRAMNPNKEQGFDEGMAEFVGRYSTVTNFKNLTWLELENQLKKAGSMNIFDLTSDLGLDVFGDWPGSGDLSDHYGMNFLLIKFLMDKYGTGIIKKIFDSTKNFGNQEKEEGDVTGKEAIEAATGMKFGDLLLEFMVWRIDKTKFSQYKESTEWPGYDVDRSRNFTGTPLEDEEDVDDLTSRVNEYILSGKDCVITAKPDGNTTLGLTIIREKEDGTKEYIQKKLGPGEAGGIYIPPGYKKVTVIKTSLEATELGGTFKMKVQPGPVITPMGPPDNDHIMWDPPAIPDIPIIWDIVNATNNTHVDIQIDNTSTFSDPYIDEIMWDTFEPYSLPRELPNGTWWWRIRWHEDLINESGPWSSPWNFTFWRGYSRPDIMWDPNLERLENQTGSWGLITPGSRIRVTATSSPVGMEPDQGTPQVRLRGQGSIIDLEPGTDDWFEVGEHMSGDLDIIEWRVDFPPFNDIPWFRDDIMWDPAPPELIPILPLPGPRIRDNTTIQIGLNDTYHVDSFFDVYYSIDLGGADQQPYDVEPMFNRTEKGLMIYDLHLNISDLQEGTWLFNITAEDEYKRRSEPLMIEFEIDRTGPEFMIETDPHGDPTFFNGSFNLFIWSEDPTTGSVMVEIHDSEGGITPMEVVPPVPPWVHEVEWKGTYDLIGQPLPQGPITIMVTVWDDLGNMVTDSIDAVIDTIAPIPMIQEPRTEDWLFLGNNFETRVDVNESPADIVSVTAHLIHAEFGWENLTLTLDQAHGRIWAVNHTLSWNLVLGNYWLEIRVTDRAGNTGIERVLVQLVYS